MAGHTDDILSLSGVSVQLPPPDVAELTSPKSPTAAVIAGIRCGVWVWMRTTMMLWVVWSKCWFYDG